jgi:DNA-binding CsgD family transcriptional regulator
VDNGGVSDVLLLPGGGAEPLTDLLTIGREAGCRLVIDDLSVSRRHAVIHEVAGKWYVEDLGSRNGTFVDENRVAAGTRCRLRQSSRLGIASTVLVVQLIGSLEDGDDTSSMELTGLVPAVTLSPYQLQVLRLLAAPWLADGSEPASNAAIARALGIPLAENSIKATLRRTYAKVGLSGVADRSKRRELCRIARERGWV